MPELYLYYNSGYCDETLNGGPADPRADRPVVRRLLSYFKAHKAALGGSLLLAIFVAIFRRDAVPLEER